jgi:hypothetical protein
MRREAETMRSFGHSVIGTHGPRAGSDVEAESVTDAAERLASRCGPGWHAVHATENRFVLVSGDACDLVTVEIREYDE